jgi:hypothetical protein
VGYAMCRLHQPHARELTVTTLAIHWDDMFIITPVSMLPILILLSACFLSTKYRWMASSAFLNLFASVVGLIAFLVISFYLVGIYWEQPDRSGGSLSRFRFRFLCLLFGLLFLHVIAVRATIGSATKKSSPE